MIKTRVHRILAALAAAPERKLRLAEICAALGPEENSGNRNYAALWTLKSRHCVDKGKGRDAGWSITAKGRNHLQLLEDTPGAVQLPSTTRQRGGHGTSRNALGRDLTDAPSVFWGIAVDGQAPRDVPSSIFALGQSLAPPPQPETRCYQARCVWAPASCEQGQCEARQLRHQVNDLIWSTPPDNVLGLKVIAVVHQVCNWRRTGVAGLKQARQHLDQLIAFEEGTQRV